jgi:hypothetical protein
VPGTGSRSKGCRGAEHGQPCTKDRTGAVAVRTALETAVQTGRGDEASRSEQAGRNGHPTKCRDSQLRFSPCGIPSTFGALPREHMSRDKTTERPRRECWCLAAPHTWTTD